MIIPERPITGAKIPQGWFTDFYDYVLSLRMRGDGKTFFISNTDGGCVGSSRPFGNFPAANDTSNSASTYEAPFTVAKLTDTSVKVVGATTNTYKNYIGLGNSWIELTEQTVTSITATGWLYIELTYSSSYTLTAKFSAGETPPTRDNTHGIILVRRIICADSKISSINLPVQIVEMGGKIY